MFVSLFLCFFVSAVLDARLRFQVTEDDFAEARRGQESINDRDGAAFAEEAGDDREGQDAPLVVVEEGQTQKEATGWLHWSKPSAPAPEPPPVLSVTIEEAVPPQSEEQEAAVVVSEPEQIAVERKNRRLQAQAAARQMQKTNV